MGHSTQSRWSLASRREPHAVVLPPRLSGLGLADSHLEGHRARAASLRERGQRPPALQRIQDAAAEAAAYVVIGVTEIEGGTLYNTLLYVGPDGALLQRHRRLMPTGGERTVWGMGDGSELGVVSTPFGVVGGLLCWENYMPPARAAIYAQHCDTYLAPCGNSAR